MATKRRSEILRRFLEITIAFCIIITCSGGTVKSNISFAENPESADSIFTAEEETGRTNDDENEEKRIFELMNQTDELALYMVKEGLYAGEFYIEQKNGVRWYSNPQGRFNDNESQGAARAAQNAQFLFWYYDSDLNSESAVVNGFVGNNNDREVIINKHDGGARVVYRYTTLKIALALYVVLRDGNLSVWIEPGEIVEQGGKYITRISMLPYFGSAGGNKEGYILVPDGSGGIINFNNKTATQPYEQRVYGDDPGFARDRKVTTNESIRFPVYGLRREDGAMVAVITEGEGTASVNAYVSGLYNSQNHVYTSYLLRNYGSISIGRANSMHSAANIYYDIIHWQTQRCETTYFFLEPSAEYFEMAECYRNYLLENKLLEVSKISSEPQLILELIGGVMRKENILGIPVTRYKKMTTFSQAKTIVTEMKRRGAAAGAVILNNSDSAEARGKLQNKVRLQSGLGGKKELSRLKEAAGSVYLNFQPLLLAGSGNGYNRYFDTAKRYDRNPTEQYTYKFSTYFKDLDAAGRFVIKPNLLPGKAKSYSSSLRRYPVDGAAISGVGSLLISDYNKNNYITRTQAIDYTRQAIETLKNAAVINPNAYALKTTLAAGLPAFGSAFDIIDYSIPFYQIVLSGFVEFSLDSFNLNGDHDNILLRTIETAASLKATLAYENIDAIIDTPYSNLFGADYTAWKDILSESHRQLREVFGQIGSRRITGHVRLAGQVFKTTFESGKSIIVNYNVQKVKTDFGQVAARSWLIV